MQVPKAQRGGAARQPGGVRCRRGTMAAAAAGAGALAALHAVADSAHGRRFAGRHGEHLYCPTDIFKTSEVMG